MKTFYVLWMPTLVEMRTPFFYRNLVLRKLQDSTHLGGYHLKGTIDGSLNITITYERTGFKGAIKRLLKRKPYVVSLHQESHILKKGFIQYSCELPDVGLDEFQKGLAGMMRAPIYHFVKDFFHNHTHHHASQDGLLQAFVSDAFVDLNARYDEISLYYLRQYRDLIKDFNEETPTQIQVSKRRINRIHKVQRGITTLGDIIKAGNDLNGQLLYMDFLITRVARQYSVPKELRSEIDILRKNTQVILSDASISYNVSTAALGVKYGIQGIKWGIGGVVVSCVIFAVSTYVASVDHSTEKYIEEAKKEIVSEDSSNIAHEVDSIRKDVHKVEQRLDNLEKLVKHISTDNKIPAK